MGKLSIVGANCKYKERDRHLKEIFRNGLNDDIMIIEIF